MVANGGTHINWGAIWGWRIISPDEPFTEGASYGTADSTKAVIILTDGANTAYDWLYDAFGKPSDERLGSGIDTASEVADEIDDRLAIAGTDKSKLLSAMIYVSDIDLRPELNEVWNAWIDPANPPTRACVGVQLEGTTNVEIIVVARK